MVRFAAVLLTAALAGCGEVPQPFRHDGAPPPLTRPKMTRGLTVRPMPAIPLLGEEVVKALEGQEIPAVLRDGPAFGLVVAAEPGHRDGRPGLLWTLSGPDGAAEPLRFQTLASPALDKATARREAAALAAAIAARLADPDASAQPGAAADRVSVSVRPFLGLPGDGDATLTKATRLALERSGLLVRDERVDYMVEGKATLIPGLPGEQVLVLSWTVRDRAGAEKAVINQEGVVPRGRLDGPWGTLARDIAEGGAAGVREVVRTARERR